MSIANNIELIIFDLDGTTVNSIYDITDSLNHTLSKYNREPIDYDSAQMLVGGGTLKLIQRAFEGVGQDNDLIEEAHVLFKENYNKNLTKKTRPYEGITKVLEHFKGKKKAILSNKPHQLTQRIIKDLDLERHFELVLGSNEKLYLSKPHKDGIVHILSKLRVKPEKAIIVGDSTHDVHAGKNAGIRTCAVTYGYRNREVLFNEQPDYLIDHAQELISLLE